MGYAPTKGCHPVDGTQEPTDSFESLYQKWLPEMRAAAFAAHIGWLDGDREIYVGAQYHELCNAAAIALWRVSKKYDQSEPWFDRVVRKSISREVRREARKLSLTTQTREWVSFDEEVAEWLQPENVSSPDDCLNILSVQKLLEQLSERHQETFELLYRQDLTQTEAAERLGVSQPMVAKRDRKLKGLIGRELAW